MRKPKFMRQEAHRRKRLGTAWRRPRGVHSKLRLRRRGKPARVSIGYSSASKTRGLLKNGKREVLISTLAQLKAIAKEETPVLSSTIGDRKRKTLLQEAQKMKVTFNNLDIAAVLNAIESRAASRKSTKKARAAKKAEREKKSKPKKEAKAEPKKETPKETQSESNSDELSKALDIKAGEKPVEEVKPKSKAKPVEKSKAAPKKATAKKPAAKKASAKTIKSEDKKK